MIELQYTIPLVFTFTLDGQRSQRNFIESDLLSNSKLQETQLEQLKRSGRVKSTRTESD